MGRIPGTLVVGNCTGEGRVFYLKNFVNMELKVTIRIKINKNLCKYGERESLMDF